jgi:1,4-dihydroxy-2-naphthoate octaprenyltransferase
MITRSTLQHSRFGFSFFLLPVFLLALLATPQVNPYKTLLVFIILHILLYPASNGFNSYYDRDTGSIGALKRPPAVTPDLLWFSLALDAAAILLSLLVDPVFTAAIVLYGFVSKAYSWNRIRLKKFGIAGWLLVAIGNGSLMFLLVIHATGELPLNELLDLRYLFPGLMVGCYLLGFYPLTQIYQHEEDSRRKDRTLSLMAGVGGTFIIAVTGIGLAVGGYGWYFYRYYTSGTAVYFFVCILPAAIHFTVWLAGWFRLGSGVDYRHMARMHLLAATGLNLFAGTLLLRECLLQSG